MNLEGRLQTFPLVKAMRGRNRAFVNQNAE